jgi:predicted RNA methylase
MTTSSSSAAAIAAAGFSVLPVCADPAVHVVTAARLILPRLERGRRVDAATLRIAMESAFGGSDAEGAWDWKSAYDVCETATVLFVRKFGPVMRLRAASPSAMLPMLARIAGLLPTHTQRSEESQAFQQFSTPIVLGLAASAAAAITPSDIVLEPSAGTGLLAILAELSGAALLLNDLADTRAGLLSLLFPAVSLTRFDAAHIDDHLDTGITPSVVLMNPPFSAVANVDRRMGDAALRHISSALSRLADGGRLVAITGANCAPDNPVWRDAFIRLQERGQIAFSAAIDGAVYARHGTTMDMRLTVIDKRVAADPTAFPASPGVAPDVATLLYWIAKSVPPRLPVSLPSAIPTVIRSVTARARSPKTADAPSSFIPAKPPGPEAIELDYHTVDWRPIEGGGITDALYEAYGLQSIRIPGARARPTKLVQSAAMASVAPPKPSYRPHLPANVVKNDLLSDAQLETVIYAGEAHPQFLAESWTVDETFDVVTAAHDDAENAVRFRQGTPIRLEQGILFTTYATLRSDLRDEKVSRVKQIVEWLGADFDGVIIFDESHAMQNAAGGKGERGDQAPSQQGRTGLRLQHALPDARIVYVSATGATTVHNLAYAQRLGLWGGDDFPFATRAEVVEAIEAGGVAAMEVLARDLKALGLYAARSLSYDGVEYELVEHRLTDEQIRIYDAYAGAFSIIHNNLDAAMRAANITGAAGALNAQAKSAARSAIESAKQRFFSHLITSMKTPSLIASVKRDLKDSHAAVIQIVSTGEALMERRLAEIPTEEWGDVKVDITPREYVPAYLAHSFPTQLYEPFTTSEGDLSSRPVLRDGQPVQCRDAVARRGRLIEKLASLPAVHGALDQIVQHFGTDTVAEVTGRSRRIIRKTGSDGIDRLVVENRAGSANLGGTQAFMDDVKRILVFSDAGGTGRSYHAELSAKNRHLRTHYLLEAGWKADAAIQGLGRTNRTNQAQPPLFRPIATNVKAEKRFLSTIARRLDTLGAITKGQRQTGGQGLFRPEDNLESHYARDALRQLYTLLVSGKVVGCSLQAFEDATGLKLTDSNGIKDDLSPIITFLNRMLALTIDLQNLLFTAFEQLLTARIEGAIVSGTYDVGLETLTAERFVVTDRLTIYTHPGTSAETRLLAITQRERNRPVSVDEALECLSDPCALLLVNNQSNRAAVQVPARSVRLDGGEVERRVRLIRPMEHPVMTLAMMPQSHWKEVDRATFAHAWAAEVAEVPEFTDSEIHIVAGLLLPIWKRLPNESTRVYRLQTDTGERIIGRKVSLAWVATVTETGTSNLTPDAAFTALLDGKTIVDLAEALRLRRVRVMGANRIELTGFTDTMRDRLRAYGLFSEIISWKLRFFVPTDATGSVVLAKVLERYPVVRVADCAMA